MQVDRYELVCLIFTGRSVQGCYIDCFIYAQVHRDLALNNVEIFWFNFWILRLHSVVGFANSDLDTTNFNWSLSYTLQMFDLLYLWRTINFACCNAKLCTVFVKFNLMVYAIVIPFIAFDFIKFHQYVLPYVGGVVLDWGSLHNICRAVCFSQFFASIEGFPNKEFQTDLNTWSLYMSNVLTQQRFVLTLDCASKYLYTMTPRHTHTQFL